MGLLTGNELFLLACCYIQGNLVPRLFTRRSPTRWRKDPGSGWSRDQLSYFVLGVGWSKAKTCLRDPIDCRPCWSLLSVIFAIIVTPLDSLITDQIKRLALIGFRASVFNVKRNETGTDDEFQCDIQLCDKDRLKNARYNFVFAHPESFLSCKFGRDLLHSKPYQDNVCAIVIDEAHCILEW